MTAVLPAPILRSVSRGKVERIAVSGHVAFEFPDGRLRHRILIAHGEMQWATYRRFAFIGPWIETYRTVEPIGEAELEELLAELAVGESSALTLPCVPQHIV